MDPSDFVPVTDSAYLINCSTYNATSDVVTYVTITSDWKAIVSFISILISVPFMLFNIKFFPIGQSGMLLSAALLQVAAGILQWSDVYTIARKAAHLRTIFMILGTTMVIRFFARERILAGIFNVVLKRYGDVKFWGFVWRVSALTAVLSPVFTAEAACFVATPAALKFWRLHSRDPNEVETILLTIISSSTIGSVVSIVGNLQMMILASFTDFPIFEGSRLDLRRSLFYLGPPAVTAFFLNLAVLRIHHVLIKNDKTYQNQDLYNGDSSFDSQDPISAATSFELSGRSIARDLESSLTGSVLTSKSMAWHNIVSDSNFELSRNSNASRKQSDSDREGCYTSDSEISSVSRNRSQRGSTSGYDAGSSCMDHTGEMKDIPCRNYRCLAPSDCLAFQVLMCGMFCAMMILFLVSHKQFHVDVGLLPFGICTWLLLLDAVINQRSPIPMVRAMDWAVFPTLMAYFIWMGGVNNSGLSHWVSKNIGLSNPALGQAKDIAVLILVILFGCYCFTSVPFLLVVLGNLKPCTKQLPFVLYVAWAATMTNMVTLYGNSTNMMVVNRGIQDIGYRLTFWRLFKYGLPALVASVACGAMVIYTMLLIPWTP
ncbi:uncharacterized protein LOC106177417 [Lingula anatina]|uniref:Uncharacterized protein LOC106177417 n=1 Tax=Lingula anatina TaxID=7574 RepID=A0A1S3K031_LINAN|nr:uncharacterized protein LOC106177417 [Lingula anatina]XP_013415631.1 uncharacterized protein LOC106177417 [Lingula anatina]|eukprot:XP_013415630.1 uncharacterized protein LOC106177417 [Lingula anatina]